MQTQGLVLLGGMILAMALFFTSLYYSISGNLKWVKFMALGLLNLALSCAALLYCGGDFMSSGHVNDLVIAAFVFLVLAAFFCWAYQLTKK